MTVTYGRFFATFDDILREFGDIVTKLKMFIHCGKSPGGLIGFLDSHRWFLMSKAFDILPIEICRLEGLKSSTPVQKAIQYVSDRIMAGELVLFNPTEKEKSEAKARLEAKRAKDREYRSRNIEAEQARDREKYYTKKTTSQKNY